MTKPANKTLIGTFVIGAVVLAVAGVVIFGSGRFFVKRYPYVMYFDSSVKGLSVGSPVSFKGVIVGTVTDIKLRLETEQMDVRIPVYIELDPKKVSSPAGVPGFEKAKTEKEAYERMGKLIDRGLRAQLGLLSFVTGQLMIELDFSPDKPIVLIGQETEIPEFPTIPSDIEELATKIQQLKLDEMINKLTLAIQGIERVVNSPRLSESLDHLNGLMKDSHDMIAHIDRRIDPLLTSIETTSANAGSLVRNLDKQISPLATNIRQTLTDTRNLVNRIDNQIDPLSTTMQSALEDARAGMMQVRETLKALQVLVNEDSQLQYHINRSLKELSSAARSVQGLTDYLERYPDSLLRGRRQKGGQ